MNALFQNGFKIQPGNSAQTPKPAQKKESKARGRSSFCFLTLLSTWGEKTILHQDTEFPLSTQIIDTITFLIHVEKARQNYFLYPSSNCFQLFSTAALSEKQSQKAAIT